MTRIIALALALAIAAGSMAVASDDEKLTDTVKSDQIRATLTAQGYKVRKIEVEDGMYEAYAMKDGQRVEVYLDQDLNIVKSEIDD